MRVSSRVVLAVFVLVTASSVWVYTQTQNTLAKYGSGGTLQSSAFYETESGVMTFGGPHQTSSEAGRLTYTSSYFLVEARNGRALNFSNGRMLVADNGNVGIGTTAPTTRLHLATSAETNGILITNAFTGHTGTDGLNIQLDGGTGNARLYLREAGTLILGTSATDRVAINSSGNVGIGTTAPAAKLHVNGNVQVDGNIAAKYQDVAEWVDADTPLAPGTVVIPDSEGRNRVRASLGAYDTAVAGVVSAQPGILLGEAGAGKIAVAQSGRVRVKVDAGFGAIRPGDLLVTSPSEGYAMRSVPVAVGDTTMHRPGTILGKALEPLRTGKGEILVLVTLQ